ncbi:MAG: EcsC family protein [bacterium]|nr:EcsC family protein [bacterium]
MFKNPFKNFSIKKIPIAGDIDENTIKKLINGIFNHGIDGVGPVTGSEDLAREYADDPKYKSTDERINALIRWESSKNFGMGLVTGLGGIITLPVSIVPSMYASWVIQARLAGAIAALYGYSVQEEKVRTFILLSILGDSGKEIVKKAGINLANRLALNAVKSISSKVLQEINKKVGFQLLTKGGEKSLVNLAKIVPAAGGIVSGLIDSISCVIVGKTAKNIFSRDRKTPGMESYHIKLSAEQISQIAHENVHAIKSIEIPEDNVIRIKLSAVPVSIGFRYIGYINGILQCEIEGNAITKWLIHSKIDSVIKKLPAELSGVVVYRENILNININKLLENRQVKAIRISAIEILENEIRVELQ